MCPHYKAFGISFNGSHAEFVKIPASAISQGNVMPLPDEVSFEEASLNEPLSCVINSISACRIVLGDRLVIYGAGPMGLLHLMLAKLSGAGVVIVCDIMDDKLERAQELGADHIINPQRSDPKREILSLTQAQGADVVVTACPAHSVQEEAIEVAAPFGRICFFGGLPRNNPKINVNTNLIHYRNLLVTGVTGGSNADFRWGLTLLVQKKIDLMEVVSAVYPLRQAHEAFQRALAGRELKIILKPHG
jgi:L-iditol 2-dehydrogenase